MYIRVKKARVSSSIPHFKNKFYKRYNLTDIDNNYDPVIMFGMYKPEDRQFYLNHKGPIIVAWCGTDGLRIDPNVIKSKEATHIVPSSFIMKDLDKYNISYKYVPFTPALTNISPKPRGDFIYFYGKRNIYHPEYIPIIKKKTKLEIIHTQYNTYNPDQLLKIYEKCFIGLRLTDHDGVPTTVVELGLMGRRSIHNGITPHSLNYDNIDRICELISLEYQNRHKSDYHQISKDWNNFINIGDDWLKIKRTN